MQPATPPTNALPRETTAPRGAVAALIGANLMLATGPWFVRMADVGPVAAGFWRIALAVPVLLAVSAAMHPGALRRGMMMWPLLLVAGLAFAADLASWHVGIVRTTLANATLFGNSAVLIFPIYGFLAARAWPSRSQGIALALAGIGAALLMGRSAELSPRNLAGDLFCLGAGILYAVYFIFMARARSVLPPVPALALSSAAGVLPLAIMAMAFGESLWPGNWWPLVALALCSQLIGQGLMIHALGHLSPLVVGIALLIQPIVAATIGWVAYGERLGALDVVGGVLVAAALVLVRRGAKG